MRSHSTIEAVSKKATESVAEPESDRSGKSMASSLESVFMDYPHAIATNTAAPPLGSNVGSMHETDKFVR